MELEQAVEQYLAVVENKRLLSLDYEIRQRFKREALEDMRAALEQRKAVQHAA